MTRNSSTRLTDFAEEAATANDRQQRYVSPRQTARTIRLDKAKQNRLNRIERLPVPDEKRGGEPLYVHI